MTLWSLIAHFVRKHWSAYILSAIMLLGIAFLSVSVPRMIGKIIDDLVAHRISNAQLLPALAYPLCAGLGMYLLRVTWRMQLFSASYRLGVELRERLYAQLACQSPAFYAGRSTGDIMALATNDIDAVEMAAGEALLAGFDGSMTLIIVLGMMYVGIDWRLALAASLPFPAMAFAFWRISTKIHDAWQDALSRFSAMNNHAQESLSGVRTMRALGLMNRQSERFGQLAQAASDASLNAQVWEARYEPAVGITLTVATSAALLVGGYLLWEREITVGILTSFSLYLGHLIWPMFAAGWVLSLLERGKAAWARLQPVLDASPVLPDAGHIKHIPSPSLTLDKVHFSYPGQTQESVSGVSVSLDAGKTLGIVGPTGSGKSTLARLILRQYEVHQGEIRFGDVALPQLTLQSLRADIAWVPQEAVLFSASITDNIRLARPDATIEQVHNAARQAAIHDDILRFADGYDTLVGERGITLSGGQRQRVAIARALLTQARLLVLDDTLSAVDTLTEARILEQLTTLRKMRPEQSAIIISHRLSALCHADHIIVMQGGSISEQGTHEQLLATDGWYAHQWRYQQLEASLDAL